MNTLIINAITIVASVLIILIVLFRKKNRASRVPIAIFMVLFIILALALLTIGSKFHISVHLLPWLALLASAGALFTKNTDKALKSALSTPLFKGRSHHAFGLAVADSSLELVDIVMHKEQLGVSYFARVQLEPGVIMRGYIRKFEKFNTAVQELFKGMPGHDTLRTVVSALPDYQVFTRLLTYKRDEYDKKEIDDEIETEMSGSLPLELNEVVIRTLKNDLPDKSKEVMVFAAYRSLIDNWVKSYEQAGLNLAGIEMESLALIRSLIRECPLDVAYFIADLGGSSTDLTIVDCHGIKLSASIACGGKYLTKIIAENMQLSIDEAERQKRDIGLTGRGHSNVTLHLDKGLQSIAEKINNEIKYFEKRGKRVDKIFLAGGTSGMPGIVEFFTEKCGRHVERGHPWINFQSEIIGSFRLSTKKLPKDQEHFYAGATGLALKGLNRGHLKKGINFLED